MTFSGSEMRLDELEKQLVEKLGRELTAREKFYVALSEACAPSRELPLDRISAEQDIGKMDAVSDGEQKELNEDFSTREGFSGRANRSTTLQ
jgi:hypothetical protein